MNKYKCLIFDHDDTSVKSTAEIHYPAHVETIRIMRPGQKPVDLNTWLLKNYHPGVIEYFVNELGFSDDEMKQEYDIWRSFNEDSNPHFFKGILEIMKIFQNRGGKIIVVSHSEADVIKRHYKTRGDGFMPDMIFGWDYDENKRKPSIWPVEQIINEYGFSPDEILMIDDLKPGVTMARNSGIDIAGAGWGHSISEIEDDMKALCDYYFHAVTQLADLLEIDICI